MRVEQVMRGVRADRRDAGDRDRPAYPGRRNRSSRRRGPFGLEVDKQPAVRGHDRERPHPPSFCRRRIVLSLSSWGQSSAFSMTQDGCSSMIRPIIATDRMTDNVAQRIVLQRPGCIRADRLDCAAEMRSDLLVAPGDAGHRRSSRLLRRRPIASCASRPAAAKLGSEIRRWRDRGWGGHPSCDLAALFGLEFLRLAEDAEDRQAGRPGLVVEVDEPVESSPSRSTGRRGTGSQRSGTPPSRRDRSSRPARLPSGVARLRLVVHGVKSRQLPAALDLAHNPGLHALLFGRFCRAPRRASARE